MVFQSPATSFNPVFSIGTQLQQVARRHLGVDRKSSAKLVVQTLGEVELPDPERTMRFYPHELSGGMLQRAMIAMAILCRPSLLIADEPTTALDVTLAEQILRLLRSLQREHGFGVFFISHDLDLVGDFCDRIAVLYAGRVVESGRADDLLARPHHPYTRALLKALPRHAQPGSLLPAVPATSRPVSTTRPDARFPRAAHSRSRSAASRGRRSPRSQLAGGSRVTAGTPNERVARGARDRQGVSGAAPRRKRRARGRPGRSLDPTGHGLRARRRVRLRQDHRRPLRTRADIHYERIDSLRRCRPHHHARRRAAARATRHAARVSAARGGARPAHDRRGSRRGAAADTPSRPRRRVALAHRGAPAGSWALADARKPLPPRVVGRAVPTGGHLAGALDATTASRPRRADIGARHRRSGADPQPADATARPARAVVPAHLTRPLGRGASERPDRRDVPRPHRRGRLGARRARVTPASVHAGASSQHARKGPRQPRRPAAAPWRDAACLGDSRRLPLSPALPPPGRQLGAPEACATEDPALEGGQHAAACHFAGVRA
jgi:energy-coupling factor transporter ATP-binding protein EcfA2